MHTNKFPKVVMTLVPNNINNQEQLHAAWRKYMVRQAVHNKT